MWLGFVQYRDLSLHSNKNIFHCMYMHFHVCETQLTRMYATDTTATPNGHQMAVVENNMLSKYKVWSLIGWVHIVNLWITFKGIKRRLALFLPILLATRCPHALCTSGPSYQILVSIILSIKRKMQLNIYSVIFSMARVRVRKLYSKSGKVNNITLALIWNGCQSQ